MDMAGQFRTSAVMIRADTAVRKTFDAMTHFSWEAIFLWNSIGGRTAFSQSGVLVDMGEYVSAVFSLGLLMRNSQGIRVGGFPLGYR